jgi:hypothetical protein
MSWHPNDLVTDADLTAYERTVLTQFDQVDWRDRREKALEDWLFPMLEGRGFVPHRLRTRFEPVSVLGYTSSAYTDRTTAANTEDGITLSAVLAASSDYLYVGSDLPFRGLSVRMHDNVNAASGALTLNVWADGWVVPENPQNDTMSGAISFAKGGALTWTNPDGLVGRSVNSTGPYFWARLALSSAPTSGTKIGPVFVIRRSRLCAAVTLRTLALIFREAPTQQDGPWTEKAEWYERQANEAFLRVADQIGGEFDTDGSDAIDEAEQEQTALEVTGGGWTLDRA